MTTRKIRTCDRCNREQAESDHFWSAVVVYHGNKDTNDSHYDLCYNCRVFLSAFMTNEPTETTYLVS